MRAAFAKQYLEFAVYNFPRQKDLSEIALRRYRQLAEKAEPPLLGGKLVEGVKKTLGWQTARILQYYTRERFK